MLQLSSCEVAGLEGECPFGSVHHRQSLGVGADGIINFGHASCIALWFLSYSLSGQQSSPPRVKKKSSK